MRCIYNLVSVLIFLLLLVPAGGAASGIVDNGLYPLSTSTGMSDNLVNTIYKDSTGYVWFGTGVALDRFDGSRIKTFPLPGDKSAPKRVNAIAGDGSGEIFIGNRLGISRLKAGSNNVEEVFADKIDFPVNALACVGDSMLYIGTSYGLFRYDRRKPVAESMSQTLISPDALSRLNEVTALIPDGAAGVWIANLTNLYYLDFATGQMEAFPTEITGAVKNMLCKDGRLYIATLGDGMLVFDKKSRRFLEPVLLGNNIVTSVVSGPGDNIFVSTDGDGIFRYSTGTGKVEERICSGNGSSCSLRSNSVYSLSYDDRGLLWVGYYQGGVDYTPYYERLFSVYAPEGILDTHGLTVRSVLVDGPRKLIGTREGLYYIDEVEGISRRFTVPDIRSNIIFSTIKHKDKYYIGTYGGGMYVFDPATRHLRDFTSFSVPFGHESVFSIVPDEVDNLWVGTSRGLFVFKDDKEVAHYTDTNSQLPSGNVYEIFFDSTGRGWVCAENGVAVWSGGALHSGSFPRGFINNQKVRHIYESSDGKLYFVPDRGDIFVSDLALRNFSVLPLDKNNPVSVTTFLVEDDGGCLWIGTEHGLFRNDKDGGMRVYNNSSGLPAQSFTLCKPVRDSDGTLWLGNTSGLVSFRHHCGETLSIASAPIVITEIEVNGRNATDRIDLSGDTPEIRLEAAENNLTVSHSNLSYIVPEYQNIEYKLDGYDDGWTLKSGSGTIRYYDLPAGDYTLRLRNYGDSQHESAMKIRVATRLNWIMVSLFVLLVIAVGCAVHFYLKHLRHREEVRRRREEAADIAQEEKRNRYRTTRMSDEDCRRLLAELDRVMTAERPYTNPDLKSPDLAAMVGASSHDLSYLFNQYLEKSYYDYVNAYRVEEFKQLVATADISRYTLTAMSQKCGFSSRASFFRYFKSMTGMTPAEYIKRRK